MDKNDEVIRRPIKVGSKGMVCYNWWISKSVNDFDILCKSHSDFNTCQYLTSQYFRPAIKVYPTLDHHFASLCVNAVQLFADAEIID